MELLSLSELSSNTQDLLRLIAEDGRIQLSKTDLNRNLCAFPNCVSSLLDPSLKFSRYHLKTQGLIERVETSPPTWRMPSYQPSYEGPKIQAQVHTASNRVASTFTASNALYNVNRNADFQSLESTTPLYVSFYLPTQHELFRNFFYYC